MATVTNTNKQITSEYQPPHDIEAEMSLLGSVILDNSVLADIHRLISPESFYHSYHQVIYEILVKFHLDEHRAIDVVILKDELSQKGLLEKVGGIDYLTSLMESVPSSANADYYARIVWEKYILRSIMLTCHQILRQAVQPNVKSNDLLNEAQRMIFDIARRKELEKSNQIKDILDDVFKNRIMESFDRKTRLLGMPTGLIELDDLLSGLQGGQLIIVAGRPGTGKSSFALKLLDQISLKENKPAAIFTLEVTDQQLVQNLLCAHSQVNSQHLRKGMIDDEAKNHLLLAAGAFRESPIFIDDSSELSPQDLRFKARRLKADYDIQILIVDYLQLMQLKGAESRQIEIASISFALKSLAKELNIPVVAMAQLSRAAEQRDTKHPRPRLSDLRESGAIEQDADVVLLLYREELYDSNNPAVHNICEVEIAKQRNGPIGRVKVTFLQEYTRFENFHQEQ
ncbi:MAG: replicative DNA helicase [Planctomycetes bacterium]|nr:replicative DNA helicase [Planctomycetota bacterium]MCK5578682.1 replicative DNA helicase [Planctomycetota bacterium]